MYIYLCVCVYRDASFHRIISSEIPLSNESKFETMHNKPRFLKILSLQQIKIFINLPLGGSVKIKTPLQAHFKPKRHEISIVLNIYFICSIGLLFSYSRAMTLLDNWDVNQEQMRFRKVRV